MIVRPYADSSELSYSADEINISSCNFFFIRPRTTQSCRHKALLSRRGPDTIEEDLAGPKAQLTLPQVLRRSHISCNVSEICCVLMEMCPNGDKSGSVWSGYVSYADEQSDDHIVAL